MSRRVVRSGTYIDELDETVEAVAEYGVDYVERIIEVLMPDGRAFGQEKLSQADELRLYESQLRGNPAAWENWINQRVQRIQEMLQNANLSEDEILNVHPLDIVWRFAVAYSAKMEKIRERRFKRLAEITQASEAALRPTAPDTALTMMPGAPDDGST